MHRLAVVQCNHSEVPAKFRYEHTDLKLAYVYDYKSRPRAPGIVKGDSALAALLLKF